MQLQLISESKSNNMWSTETYMMIILLFGQIAQCILSSRCTRISSPCFTIERDVIPAQEVAQRLRSNSNPVKPETGMCHENEFHVDNENNV